MFCSCDDYYFGPLEMYKKLFAGNLGVIFDSNLMFDKQINAAFAVTAPKLPSRQDFPNIGHF